VVPTEEVKLPELSSRVLNRAIDHPAVRGGSMRFILYKRVVVRIGKPIDLSGFLEQPLTKTAIDTLSGKLRRIVIKLYNGEDLERFVEGKLPFDIYTDRV